MILVTALPPSLWQLGRSSLLESLCQDMLPIRHMPHWQLNSHPDSGLDARAVDSPSVVTRVGIAY